MRIINIVDNVTKVNFGIWNAAISTSPVLLEKYGIKSELWAPAGDQPIAGKDYEFVPLSNLSSAGCLEMIRQRKLSPESDIIITHGNWRFCTTWGNIFARKNFVWIAVPHGMLRQVCMNIKPWKKYPYFYLVERPRMNGATAIRAVSKHEYEELKQQFSRPERVFYIPNCVELPDPAPEPRGQHRKVLFMARINFAKRVVELVKAWATSELYNHPRFSLDIAGPDHGALAELQAFLESHKNSNMRYIGPQYGSAKEQLLRTASAYVLPCTAESFPTSVVEALSFGLVTLITRDCNFYEPLDADIAIEITASIEGIRAGLNKLAQMPDEEWQLRSRRSMELISSNYTVDYIAEQQMQYYKDLLANKKLVAH